MSLMEVGYRRRRRIISVRDDWGRSHHHEARRRLSLSVRAGLRADYMERVGDGWGWAVHKAAHQYNETSQERACVLIKWSRQAGSSSRSSLIFSAVILHNKYRQPVTGGPPSCHEPRLSIARSDPDARAVSFSGFERRSSKRNKNPYSPHLTDLKHHLFISLLFTGLSSASLTRASTRFPRGAF